MYHYLLGSTTAAHNKGIGSTDVPSFVHRKSDGSTGNTVQDQHSCHDNQMLMHSSLGY